jgi:hypothetical protein
MYLSPIVNISFSYWLNGRKTLVILVKLLKKVIYCSEKCTEQYTVVRIFFPQEESAEIFGSLLGLFFEGSTLSSLGTISSVLIDMSTKYNITFVGMVRKEQPDTYGKTLLDDDCHNISLEERTALESTHCDVFVVTIRCV